MTTYLSIDLGDKRTGLATGDDETGLVSPVGAIDSTDPASLLKGIRDAIDQYAPDALVMGVPYNMDGSLGERAKKAQALAALLEQSTQLPVHPMDERLTSFAADEQMSQSGLTHKQKKQRRDALAAAAILRDFLAGN